MFTKDEAKNIVALINRGLKSEPLNGLGDVFVIVGIVNKLTAIIEAPDGKDVSTTDQ